MPKKIVDYSNTIIYKIYCKDECITDIYVGHTTNFIQRKSTHKVACNNQNNDLKIYKIIRENGGWTNWDMIEISKYNCKDSTEARIKENEHYNQLKATLNSYPPYVDKKNYFCLNCNLQCSTPKQYETHLKCVKHNNLKVSKEDNDSQKTQELCFKFYCIFCDYGTCKKSNYNTHLSSVKHNRVTTDDIKGYNSAEIQPEICNKDFICKCGKMYQHRQGLWRHKNKCTNNDNKILLNNTTDNTKNEPTDKEVILMLIKENYELKNMMMKVI